VFAQLSDVLFDGSSRCGFERPQQVQNRHRRDADKYNRTSKFSKIVQSKHYPKPDICHPWILLPLFVQGIQSKMQWYTEYPCHYLQSAVYHVFE
jgi:hypothetical protein